MSEILLEVEQLEDSNYTGWCTLGYKGAMVRCYYDGEFFRYTETSTNVLLRECITHVITPKPNQSIRDENRGEDDD